MNPSPSDVIHAHNNLNILLSLKYKITVFFFLVDFFNTIIGLGSQTPLKIISLINHLDLIPYKVLEIFKFPNSLASVWPQKYFEL